MTILKADKGKLYTDGINFGTTVQLASHRSKDEFYEITDEQYEELVKQQHEAIRKEQATSILLTNTETDAVLE